MVSTPKVAWNNGLAIVTYLRSWRSECLELVFSTCYSDQLALSTLLMIQIWCPSPLRRSTTVPCWNAPFFPVFHMMWNWRQRTVLFNCNNVLSHVSVGPALDHPGIRRQDTNLWCGAVDNSLWFYLTGPIISSLTIFWLRKIAVFFYCIFISGPESEDVIGKCNLRYYSNFSIISSRLVFKMWIEVSGQKISEKLSSRVHLTV